MVDSKYKISKAVPLPPNPSNASKYPFRKMEVGDSFVVPTHEVSTMASLRSSASAASKRMNKRFRVVLDDTLTTPVYRVFRLE